MTVDRPSYRCNKPGYKHTNEPHTVFKYVHVKQLVKDKSIAIIYGTILATRRGNGHIFGHVVVVFYLCFLFPKTNRTSYGNTMKHSIAASAASISLGLLLFGAVLFTDAVEKIKIEIEDIVFKVKSYHFDENPSIPIVVIFLTEDVGRSKYSFDADLRIKKFIAGSEKYVVRYKADGTLRGVVRKDSGARVLLSEEEEEYQDVVTVLQQRRLHYPCDDCEADWNDLCGIGIPTVCSLDGHASLGDSGISSVATLCHTFGASCSHLSGDNACDGQCVGT